MCSIFFQTAHIRNYALCVLPSEVKFHLVSSIAWFPKRSAMFQGPEKKEEEEEHCTLFTSRSLIRKKNILCIPHVLPLVIVPGGEIWKYFLLISKQRSDRSQSVSEFLDNCFSVLKCGLWQLSAPQIAHGLPALFTSFIKHHRPVE